jgi:hypothetical protein
MARRASTKAFPASGLARPSEECGQTSVQPNLQEVDRSGVAAFDAVGQSIPLGPPLPAGLEPLVNLARLLPRQVARVAWKALFLREAAGSQAEENSGTWEPSSPPRASQYRRVLATQPGLPGIPPQASAPALHGG